MMGAPRPCIWPEKPIAVSPLSALPPNLDVGEGAGQRRGPVVGILFRPPGTRTVRRKGPGLARDWFAALVGQKRLKSEGSAVKQKIHGLALCAGPATLTSAGFNPPSSASPWATRSDRTYAVPTYQCRQASQQDDNGVGVSQAHSGSASSLSNSTPRSRMYLRPDRIGWSASRVASPTPFQSRSPA